MDPDMGNMLEKLIPETQSRSRVTVSGPAAS